MTTFKERVIRASAFEDARTKQMFTKIEPQIDGNTIGIWFETGIIEENKRLQPYMELLGDALLALMLSHAREIPNHDPDTCDQPSCIVARQVLARADGMLPKGDV